MSNLPGFRKSGVTKFSELEMEDTFLQNLQVMNRGSKEFMMEDSSLNFQKDIYEDNDHVINKLSIGLFPGMEDTNIQMESIYNDVIKNESSISVDNISVIYHDILEEGEEPKEISTMITPWGIGMNTYNEETQHFYETQPVLLNEQGEIDSKYLPRNTMGIIKASEMNQTSFWDTDVVVPTGHTLTNADGIPGEQITSGYISPTHIHNLSAGKINSGTLNIDRIPDLTTSKISDLDTTLQGYAPLTNNKISVEAIPNLSSTAGITIDAGLIQNAPWKSTLKLSEMEIDQDLNMETHTIYVGTTATGKTAIYNRGIQTITSIGDTYEFLNGELIASAIDTHILSASTYHGLPTSKLSNLNIDTDLDMGNRNITTTGTVTASNIPSST